MILLRILRNDVARTRGTMTVVFAFVFLSAFLIAGGISLIGTLNGALDELFTAAKVPDVVQMHAGDFDRGQVDGWAASSTLIEQYQIAEMITLDGDEIYIGSRGTSGSGAVVTSDGTSEKSSVMDISVVHPNVSFDLLLDQSNTPFAPNRGEIGVPLYYAQRADIALGDTVTIRSGAFTAPFQIAAFIRDAQMNPSIVHSKRFVVHRDDFAHLGRHIPAREYLIEFRLTDRDRTDEFIAAYQAAGLPQRGPIVDRTIFRTLNALSDGIVAAVIVVVSLVLMIIAILCLRFTILASIESDFREIGVMKAIGVESGDIRRIYMAKYVALGALASAAGYALSFLLADIPAAGIIAYMGTPAAGFSRLLAPAVGTLGVLGIVVVSTYVILRRIGAVSAVAALSGAGMKGDMRRPTVSRLNRVRRLNVNVFLGLDDTRQRSRLFLLLGLIFIFATFTIIVPVHFLNTITSPSFISYMGIGRSDIRIDLRQTDDSGERYASMVAAIGDDPAVARYAPLVTSQFSMVDRSGRLESIAIETGDIAEFPLDYIRGGVPANTGEIALSYLNAQEMELSVGDTMTVLIDKTAQPLTVSGIYQDVTNGGRTAKALFPHNPAEVLWYSVSLDVAEGVSVPETTERYMDAFTPARVTDLEGYLSQTFGTTITRVRTVTVLAIVVGICVSILITSLFMQMLIKKDATEIAIRRALGFSWDHIRTQYTTTIVGVLTIGVVAGTIFSNTIGQRLVSIFWSFLGASRISFVIEPLKVYVALPLLFAAVVTLTIRATMSETTKELP